MSPALCPVCRGDESGRARCCWPMEEPRPCATPGCNGFVSPRRRSVATLCDLCRGRRRGSRGRPLRHFPLPPVSTTRPRVFEFDAVRIHFPKDKADAVKGFMDEGGGWQLELANRLVARYPQLTESAARQRVVRLRGRMIDEYLADAIAVGLGVHPSEIWDNWWAEVEVGE